MNIANNRRECGQVANDDFEEGCFSSSARFVFRLETPPIRFPLPIPPFPLLCGLPKSTERKLYVSTQKGFGSSPSV